MSVENGNGTVGQYRQFYGERAEMPAEVLSMESLALVAFNFERLVGDINFNYEFWSALRLTLQSLSNKSLDIVKSVQQQSAAGSLLSKFGAATSEQAMMPHKELTAKVVETQNNLNFNLSESKLALVLMIQQIKQLIFESHQEKLSAIPTEDSDNTVVSYVSVGAGAGKAENPTVHKSFIDSQKPLDVIIKKNKTARYRINASLVQWLNFISGIESTIFGATTQVKSKLSTA
jgi:hypothetical protein